MRIKSYYSQTIPAAMERARVELGPDAMIVASHKTSGDAERLGVYEVVFGLVEKAAPAPSANPVPATATPPPMNQGLERLKGRMEDLRKSVTSKREQVSSAKAHNTMKVSPALQQAGFVGMLADEIAASVQSRLRDKKQDVRSVVGRELANRIRLAPRLGVAGQSRGVVALVGPSGVGKTTTLVKLAVQYGVLARRQTRLISVDTYRLGGADLLRKYAEAMGVKLETPANASALERCLDAGSGTELLLIDTPVFKPGDNERSAAIASLLARRADIDVHLVLPAFASGSDLDAMAERCKHLMPSKIIFTGLDQSAAGGAMVAHAIDSGLPVSFTCSGVEVPEDLEEASHDTLLSKLLPALVEAVASAA